METSVFLYYAVVLVAFGSLIVVFPIVWLVGVQSVRIYTTGVPASIPWAGLQGKLIFPKLRATLRDFSAKRVPIEEGYKKYGKHNKSYILPSLHGPEVILPPSHVRWMVSQPENVLSVEKVQDHLLALPFLAHGPDSTAIHDFSVITRDMTRQIGKLSPAVYAEIESVLGDELEVGKEWVEIRPTKVTEHAAERIASRVFVGTPLYRDTTFRSRFHKWATAFGYIGLFLRVLIPTPMFPIVARFVSVFATFLKWKVAHHLVPEIQQRLDQLGTTTTAPRERKPLDGSDRKQDILQWVIEDAANSGDPRFLDPWNIMGKIMLFQLFAEHTTAKTSAIVIFDIVSYAAASDLIEQLRGEAEDLLPQIWTDPHCTRKMTKLDSVIRESMRFHPMSAHGLVREVVQDGGVTTPDGLHLPKGCRVGGDVANMQRDPEFCKGGNCYEPLRYHGSDTDDSAATKQKASTHISENFLSFSLGKHACPGRFFAVHVIKLLLSYILVNYDFQPLEKRPEFLAVGDMVLPPSEATIKIRCRRRFTMPKA